MSKLTRKFLIGLSVILGAVAILSLYLNANFVERYFLYQEKQEMNRICDRLTASAGPLDKTIRELEESEDVVIAYVQGTEDNEILNERLRKAFLDKGISLKKYWLWEQDQQDAMRNGRKMRIYRQEKLHYSLLVEYLSWDGNFVAAAMIIPAMDRTLSLINRVTAVIFLGAVCAMFLLICILVRRITGPLQEIGRTARAISNLDFQTARIHTGDELEALAQDINHMSRSLKEAKEALEEKNRQMEELLANVSHDLKTPVALIKAYSSGIQDGMDDGTFLDTIIAQNERMEKLIERLLNLAKLKQMELQQDMVDMSADLWKLVEEYRFYAGNRSLTLRCEIEDSVVVNTSQEAVRLIYTNLLSNAVKYSAEGEVVIRLGWLEEGRCRFQVGNPVSSASVPDVRRVWEPFYVGENSRNKNGSGTGLGLSIVKAAADQVHAVCDCTVDNGMILFTVLFES